MGIQETEGSVQTASLERIETESMPERVHGLFETVQLYSHQFIKVAQIRPGQNGALEELKNSIEHVGMLNAIDSARLGRDLLDEYIRFTNKVWGDDKRVEDFDSHAIDGVYYLVCGGGSRHEGITQLEDEGRIAINPMLAKVHPAKTVQDILDLQDAENIHTRPPIERRSFVAVESYLWGVEQGQWSSIKEYAEARGLSRRETGLVADAVLFINLPIEFRDFVLKKKMSYAAGVELARSSGVLRESIAHRIVGMPYEDIDDVELMMQIDDQILRELVIKANTIARGRLNSSASIKLLKSWQKELRDSMRHEDELEKEAGFDLFDVMITPAELLAEMRRNSQAKITEFMRDYGRTPASSALELLELNKNFVDPELAEKVRGDFVESARHAVKMVGGSTLHSVSLTDELFEEIA